ncbi:DUF4179 domain-containing protein [Paenibacillus sp. L3-i20]|uniref:DUF4179 domain-containing protein n=1 Tax=Paenibacillus sp. L3-i20 TaxID=2905833 RepID=UPI001EDDD95B|nr:DUF4179 domain-containing protein [Paenibacillus sp. L3-i20]GKU77726.1 hypothetical protein L3i20_v221230 [Paenibacillus sp. L3-i20]
MEQSWKKDDKERDDHFELEIEKLMKDKQEINSLMNVEGHSELQQKLDAVILNGVIQGRKRSIKQRRTRITLQMGAAAICLMLMLTAFVRISPVFAAVMKEIPGFSRFVEMISYDKSLLSAINNDFMQPINVSDERNGFKFTVNGVIADSQRIVLFYTAEGPGINEEDTSFLKYDLRDENGDSIVASIMSYNTSEEVVDKNGGVQEYLDILMSPDAPVPHEIQFKLQVGTEWLKVNIPIDHNKFAGMVEHIEVNKTIEVAGQKLTIRSALITPLQVSIDIESDPHNSKQLNDFIDLELVDERGIIYKTNVGRGELDNQITRHFQSSYFQKPKQLTLTSKGLMMTERDLKLVMNTDTGEIIAAPDSKVSLAEVTKKDNHIDVTMELEQGDDPGKVMRGYELFKYNSSFKDAEGNEFQFESDGNSVRGDPDGVGESLMGTYNYRIPRRYYVQPLTFEIGQYPGYVLENIVVKIK